MSGPLANAARVAAVGDSTNGEPLCQTCKRLGLDAILSHPRSSTVRYSQDTQMKIFSWKDSTQWSRTCPLCELFRLASGNRQGDTRTPYALRLVARSLMNAHDWNMPEPAHLIVKGPDAPLELDREELRNREFGLLFLAVTKDHEQDECSTAELTADVRRSGMVSWWHADDRRKNEGRGRVIDDQKADFDLVKNWLGYCEKHHRKCRAGNPRSTVEHFQIIDCTNNNIIPAPAKCDYVALSYVWGQSSSSNNEVSGKKLMVQRLPRTVSDAILATERLGYRYLWVDRYCIPNDPGIKHTQISKMDVIYQNAVATLIAASGNDATCGLAGMGSRDRTRQSSVQLGNITVFTTLPHPDTIIQKSVWMTRGWTYQEAVLSRRRIFFTDQQLYFECNSMQCFESLPPALDDWHTADKDSFLSLVDRSIFTVPTSSVGLSALRLFTSEYTRRNLTFDMDSLNGFLGVLAYFESLEPSFRHWWGLSFTTKFDLHSRPYAEDFVRLTKARAVRGEAFREAKVPGRESADTVIGSTPRSPPEGKNWNPEHCFLNALLWKHLETANRRRAEFPSWTWVGWAGALPGLTLDSGYHGCICHPEQRVPRVLGAMMEDKSFKSWAALVPLLSSRRTPLIRQPRAFVVEARTVQVEVVEVQDAREEKLVSNGWYITRKIGSISLLDGSLDDCTVFAPLNLSNENDVLVETEETEQLGYAGLILGCGGNNGLLVVRPVKGGGCERVGTVDIKHGSEFLGEIRELNLMKNGEDSRLRRHWYDKEGYHSINCSVYDVGDYVAVSPGNTAVEDWGFKETILQTVLR